MNKLKVLMVCSFSNAKVREHLPLGGSKLYGMARKILGLPAKDVVMGDVAGWDTYMIENLRKRDDIELFVVCAHIGMTKRKVEFELDGVHYFFLKCEYATFLKHVIKSPALWHKLNPLRLWVKKIVSRLTPDVIALIGAENSHISGTVLGLKGYPLIVKCQTIYNNPKRRETGSFDEKNAYVERKIFESLKYVSVTSEMHERLFRKMNKTAINFLWDLGNLLPEVNKEAKLYDFVNFAAGMSPRKGFPDAIQALAIVKRKITDVKLNLVGGWTEEYKQELIDLAVSLGVIDNVEFTPFFEKQEDMFQHIQKSRFALLPCKMDFISSTMRQAMHYGLPLVCYQTEGTVTLNKTKPCVLIAENSNVENLAQQMIALMCDPVMEEELRRNAKEYSKRWDEAERITNQMTENFKAVVENYRNGTPVPEELLFKPEEIE